MSAMSLIPVLCILAVVQTKRTCIVSAWKQKPECSYWMNSEVDAAGRTPLEQGVQAISPSVRLADLRLDGPDGPTRRAHLYVVGRDEAPVPRADLDALARGLWDVCRWDDRYDARPPLVATNADTLPVDIEITYRAAPGSPMTPEAVEGFQRLITRDIERSFEPGPADGRHLAADCWHYWALPNHPVTEVASNFRVYSQPDVLFDGHRSCFEGRTEPAFPKLGTVTVSVRPP
jgi:hypothetical protein